MTNTAEANQRVQQRQEPKRRRYNEVEDTSSSNQLPSLGRHKNFVTDNGQCSSKPQRVEYNEDMELKERLFRLHTTLLTQKIKSPTNYASDMVSLLNRPFITSTESPPWFNPSSSHTQNPQVPPPPIKIPTWMPLLFRPPSDMSLSDTDAELAVYIFLNSQDLDDKEVLILSFAGLAIGDRETLRSIMPTNNISSQFIHMVELALNNKTTSELSREYKDTFMGHVDLIKKIFLPVNENGIHWYLVVFDLEEKSLWFLDSNPFPDDFDLIEPEGLKKHLTSYNDCGVQVAKWMMECISNHNYQSIGVNAQSRIRLVLDLVLDRHNHMRNETVRKAHEKFKDFNEDSDICDDI
ncbi:Ulp1 protease family, C-terminal catalytic domain [Sesbania bispinosa]|nr:Ulp1 protease family, C-terminal catalytic domain [Sesbania bispinosa]